MKRRLCYKSHECFESVRSEFIHQALTYLKESNAWYYGFAIDLEKMPNSLLSLSDNSGDQELRRREEDENPLNLHRFDFQVTVFVPTVLSSEEISIPPNEGKQPTSI